jgi:Uma2 family endonuclease
MRLSSKIEKNKHYTYADYATWSEDIHCELLDGRIYMMTAPLQIHTYISNNLTIVIGTFLQGHKCKLHTAPSDVRLNHASGDDTVLQPDLFVVCDRSKLDGRSCLGAPDLVIEILSPSTARNDLFLKYHKYLTAGVLEYWIVHPENRIVDVCILEDGIYKHTEYKDDDTIKSVVLQELTISLSDIFRDIE